jgi:hypothetical protein
MKITLESKKCREVFHRLIFLSFFPLVLSSGSCPVQLKKKSIFCYLSRDA